jgi:prepilin-type N-terminal cleavage/methylation domain-containing protein
MADAMSHKSKSRRVGFTLIELLAVITIIGLLISLILVAANDGVRRAEERATQSLITKLETALNDRLDALLNTQTPINQTHRFLASINVPNAANVYVPVGSSTSNSDDRRAQVIAQTDFIKSELPDVFFLNSQTSDGGNVSGSYPLNFAAAPYPSSVTVPISLNFGTNPGYQDGGSFVLPLGNNSGGVPFNQAGNLVIASPQLPATGMFGASFAAAGGIYKNLGYAPTGYDGVDNNGNGLIDEYAEGILNLSPAAIAQIQTNLSNHTHKTARSEMLYAILVEGLSPLGSSFSREDFTNREVQDTDGDGLPEFIDAWGEPLQFYRWPIYYGGAYPNGNILGTSDSQRGYNSYGSPSDFRDQDPLDTNQLLVSPGWWSNAANPSLTLAAITFSTPSGNANYMNGPGPGAIGFMNYFHSLVDPNPTAAGGTGWDRGSNFCRRAYFSKFLILSGGPDHQPATARFALDYNDWTGNGTDIVKFPDNMKSTEQNALLLNYIENQAAVCDPVARLSSGSFWETPSSVSNLTTLYLQQTANADDITNHNISGISTGVR